MVHRLGAGAGDGTVRARRVRECVGLNEIRRHCPVGGHVRVGARVLGGTVAPVEEPVTGIGHGGDRGRARAVAHRLGGGAGDGPVRTRQIGEGVGVDGETGRHRDVGGGVRVLARVLGGAVAPVHKMVARVRQRHHLGTVRALRHHLGRASEDDTVRSGKVGEGVRHRRGVVGGDADARLGNGLVRVIRRNVPVDGAARAGGHVRHVPGDGGHGVGKSVNPAVFGQGHGDAAGAAGGVKIIGDDHARAARTVALLDEGHIGHHRSGSHGGGRGSQHPQQHRQDPHRATPDKGKKGGGGQRRRGGPGAHGHARGGAHDGQGGGVAEPARVARAVNGGHGHRGGAEGIADVHNVGVGVIPVLGQAGEKRRIPVDRHRWLGGQCLGNGEGDFHRLARARLFRGCRKAGNHGNGANAGRCGGRRRGIDGIAREVLHPGHGHGDRRAVQHFPGGPVQGEGAGARHPVGMGGKGTRARHGQGVIGGDGDAGGEHGLTEGHGNALFRQRRRRLRHRLNRFQRPRCGIPAAGDGKSAGTKAKHHHQDGRIKTEHGYESLF